MHYYINNLKSKVEATESIKRLIDDIAPTRWEVDEIKKAWDEIQEKHGEELEERDKRIRELVEQKHELKEQKHK